MGEKSSNNASWIRDWSAAFYLDVKTSSYNQKTEFLTYDIWELTSGLGGLLGLFVGTSFLGIIFGLQNITEKLFLIVKYQHSKIFK